MQYRTWLSPVAFLLYMLPSVQGLAETLRVGVISQSANNWPLFVAEEKGFFQRAGLQVEVVVTGDSGRNIDGLVAGKFEITHQASDHFVRAAENGKDLFVFMTISRPIFDYVVQPGITAITDLKGKTLAIDRPTTGYWLLFQKAFARNGLFIDNVSRRSNRSSRSKRWG